MRFTVYCNQGLIHDHLIELLTSKGWIYVKFDDIHTNETIDFAWVGATIGNDYLKFDQRVYNLKTILKNLLVGSGVRGDYKDKDTVTNKYELYYNIMKLSPVIGEKHLCISYDLKRLTTLYKEQILIARPVGVGAGGGQGIRMITNNSELAKAKYELGHKYKYILASEYIKNPMLFNSRKFHLRMYWMVYPDKGGNYYSSLFSLGKIITAGDTFKCSDWHNTAIHDSHFKSTGRNCYFPEDMGLSPDIINSLWKQMEEIISVAFQVILPNAKCYEDTQYGFEVFGCDFMVTSDYIVKLLEINARHDYGVDDMKKYNQEGFAMFCSRFYEWIYNKAVSSIFS